MTARDNPIGLDGFEFVEFTGPDPDALAEGPCALRNSAAWPDGSMFSRKCTSPWQ